ncbi:DENN domain-containing protein 2C isoform X2 [Gouania willdenowi]|uniref:DENN domain-containing protein 2C isoform X2 n=1 Tax=Gouania willdenowi TaxID=441366 RepID=UPI00105681B9|nr:DENN domain-containing protein 2C-like isoform X2 [Gouania willdenowi]
MLALRLEQGRRRVGDVDRLHKEVWHSGRPSSQEKNVNIREKISQWEGRSQQSNIKDLAVKSHLPVVSQTKSGFPLRSEDCVLTYKSEPLRKSSTQFLTTTSGIQNLSAQQNQTPNKLEANTALSTCKKSFTSTWETNRKHILDVEVLLKPLPPSSEDQDDSLPAGNFYTSRGFWRKLEGDKLHWENGSRSSGEVVPPPKPQRTFEYQGARNQISTGISPKNHLVNGCSRRAAGPPNFPPPPCPDARGEGLSRHKKNRKSFEYEDAARLTQRSTLRDESRNSTLYHAYSEDNIYEDIACEVTRDNPYEDVKLSPMCIPIARPPKPKLPPKSQMTYGYAGKEEKKHRGTQKTNRTPQYINKIETIFDDKRGRKRVKNQGLTARDEASGTESDPEDNTKGSKRSVYKQSTLKRQPGYRTLERDLIQLQQKQQLFQIFVVVSLRKDSSGNTYSPEITQQFPKMFDKSSRMSKEAEDQLKVIPKFCFPDSLDWKPSASLPSETFSFVLTGEDGSRWFCYCRKILPGGKGKRLPEVHCIVSKLGCFNLFAKILEEVERRREISPALVYPFMRSVMEAPFPAPGRTVTVKSFLPGSGNEVLTLCRPVDSRLEHVDFDSLLQCLSVDKLLQVFASLLLERRVIFVADKLSVLSRCAHAVLALLYPFTWQHTFIPVLPVSMLDISCSPTPFLIGVLAQCLPELLELPIEEVLIVDLCEGSFVVQLGDEDCILPHKLQAALQQILEEREEILRQDHGDEAEGQQADLSSLVSEGFVHFFVELVGHYPQHLVETANGSKEFQRDNFRKSHPSRGVRLFLQLFMETQMFAGFIQDKELRKGRGRGLFEARVAEYSDSCPEPETSSVNKFLKGLGNKMKLLQIK